MVRIGRVVRSFILCGLALTTLGFAKTNKNGTIVTYPSNFAVSDRVADLPVDFSIFPAREMPEPRPSPNKPIGNGLAEDPVAQKKAERPLAASKGIDFDGIPSPGYAPSDSNMAVSANYIVETVNVQFEVFSKTGSSLAGPTNIQSLFAPLGGVCASTFGDPIVLYDRPADRWLISMIGSPGGNNAAECIAVSKTNDPTGAYYLYGYSFGGNLNDYPKLSTWATASNSAYLATYDIFQSFSSFTGADLCGFDRTKMLAGNSTAAQLCKQGPASEFSYLPGDYDGPTPPADGTPGVFINHDNGTTNQLYLRTLALNFASGTATLSAATKITVASFSDACHSSCVPEVGGTNLDALGDLQMYRFAIRHFADHDRAVLNNTVLNSGVGAVRWYELYDPTGAVTLNQQGTYAPDSSWRWMASAAEDQNADIAIGYSASSSSIHPANRFAGRVPSDPSGTLESEISIIEGGGSQTGGLTRWGDYSALQVDPADDCTFWYVAQYEQASGSFNWHTRIASFSFNGCGNQNPNFSLSANPTTVTVAQGSTGTSTITITPINGFSGSVNLSATGMPSGVTAGFSPNPATTTSTLTFTVPSGTPTGSSTVTVTGISGSLTNTTTVTLTVTASGPVVSLTPTSLTWGKVLVGVKSGAKKVTVQNTGASTLTFNSIATTGDFALVPLTSKTACKTSLAAGASCIVKVTFTPTQTGVRTGSLNFTDNAPGSPQSVALKGTGK